MQKSVERVGNDNCTSRDNALHVETVYVGYDNRLYALQENAKNHQGQEVMKQLNYPCGV